jgi:TRAP-type uncharacterized transport system substrate-binding protein
MSVTTTYRIFREDVILTLQNKHIEVFNSDSNERLAYELCKAIDSDFENYEVVDFEKENEPENDKWPYWKYGF